MKKIVHLLFLVVFLFTSFTTLKTPSTVNGKTTSDTPQAGRFSYSPVVPGRPSALGAFASEFVSISPAKDTRGDSSAPYLESQAKASHPDRTSQQEPFFSVTGELEPIIPDQPLALTNEGISLIREGWSQDAPPMCTPSGDCLTILPGYYYWIYENPQYPCGSQGNHQFMVIDHADNLTAPKDLFVKFPGGAVGFWYLGTNDERLYYPDASASALLTARYFQNLFFRSTLSEEHANGVTKRFRQNSNFRILITSYCSHDLYHGQGEYNEIDGFNRWGYSAAMSAVDYTQQNFTTGKLITYGGSAGAAGAFYVGKDQDNVIGIIMDSQAVDLSAISDACYAGFNVFGNTYPCFCPDGGLTCMEVLKDRIGFTFHEDEPYNIIQTNFDVPIYFVWNEFDASKYAHLQFENLHAAIQQFNPGGNSVANMVCINDPDIPGKCNLHVPSGQDIPDSLALVNEIVDWALSLTGQTTHHLFLPLMLK